MTALRVLCHLHELPDGGSRGFLREGLDDQLCVVRQGEDVFIWRNDCPHEHRPMEYRQDRFLSADGSHIVCYAHSAHFDIRTGECFAGPCKGKRLNPVPVHVEDGMVWIPVQIPSIFD
ncbi:(2Fe-2S)-binding protein [Robbsia andropogonis]|uniref:(2Fe-2S)-binding protein n=1 Tax=Robbsia andropogonis TaxID=28092 RepID=A0A0F5JVG1_9BURK|nr:Rieske (2Fe-2S) protein [Robbsia andropogonis]KKB61856.1 (2Fe-2S)-binding protein [Robbsia andropogonis]MCP1118653.1 Rieske (2Fe-2S) protein [Robbsia andropogonis]MCP1128120.1 Rieske (2Fe-2S) protein [Robbsia andropogonis]